MCFFFLQDIYLHCYPNLMRQVKNARMNLPISKYNNAPIMCQYQIHKAAWCKIPKASPRTYIFQRIF